MIELNMGIKNAGLHADFKFVEKVVKKMYQKRVFIKNVADHALFQLLLMNVSWNSILNPSQGLFFYFLRK
jgi:hypothetical protein